MKNLYIRKTFDKNSPLIILEFSRSLDADTVITIEREDCFYDFNKIINHIIANYPDVLGVERKDYKVKHKYETWKDEFDSYGKEIFIHKIKDNKIEVIDGEDDYRNIDIPSFLSELNKISIKNGYEIKLTSYKDEWY